MEKVASQVSEKVIPTQEKQDEAVKKIEFNVDAKEFIPELQHDGLQRPEPRNVDQPINQKTAINKKIGDNYKPVFMDGMTEKFIQGPYVGNGKDPEIPFVRYYSKGQAIDFFNKKYFSAEPSGDISFRGGESAEQEDLSPPQQQPQQQQKSYFDSSYVQSNIFRPPFVDYLVQDILYWQYLAASQNKAVSRRTGGKQYFVRRKEEVSRTEEAWEEAEGDQFPAEPETESPPNDLSKAIREQRPVKTHKRMNFTNSNCHVLNEFRAKNGQYKPDTTHMRNHENKEDDIVNDCTDTTTNDTDEHVDLADFRICEGENDSLRTIENVSIAVNITVDAPAEVYIKESGAKEIAEPIMDGETSTNSLE